MAFTEAQTQSLLSVKGIGKTVLQRLQQMGLDDTAKLAAADVGEILQQGAALTGSTCWKTVRRQKRQLLPQSNGRAGSILKIQTVETQRNRTAYFKPTQMPSENGGTPTKRQYYDYHHRKRRNPH